MPDIRLGDRELSLEDWAIEHARVADEVLTFGPSGELLDGSPLVADPHLRRAIGSLFARAQAAIDTGTFNVVILAARRLVCLYELLVKRGMPRLQGCLIVSDRYLETNPTFKTPGTSDSVRVLVLDDSVVLGTTLRRLYGQLLHLIGPGGTVAFRAACVDVEQVAPFLFDGLDFEAILQRTSVEVQQFAADVVKALFAHQIPFFADFPVGSAVELAVAEWTNFVTSCPWNVADVTAPGFERIGRAVAFIPSDDAMNSFLSRMIPEVAVLIDAIKLRFYIRHRQDDSLSVVPVPIVVIGPASVEVLDSALSAIRRVGDGEGVPYLRCETWQPEAKHRLVQIYGSVCVMADIWPHLGRTPTVDDLEAVPMQLYFGPQSKEIFDAFGYLVSTFAKTKPGAYLPPTRLSNQQPRTSDLLLESDLQRVLWASQELLAELPIPDEAPQMTDLTKIGTMVSHAVAAIFGYVNEHDEARQRRDIKALGSFEAYQDWLSAGNVRILDQGFTLRELTESLLPDLVGDSAWTRSLLLLGIDEGNDLGVIVPITRYDEVRDLAYRSYRLGETAGLAATPLATLAFAPATVSSCDRFVAAMLAGAVPALPTTIPITEAFLPGPVPYPAEAFTDPVQYTRAKLKGLPALRYEGTVLEISADRTTFLADLLSYSGDEERIVEFPLDMVPVGARDDLELGTPIRWTVSERDSDDGLSRDRTSTLQLTPVPPVDLDQLEWYVSSMPSDPMEGDAGPGGR